MFIVGDERQRFQVHLNATDHEGAIEIGGNLRITLSFDKAKELEDRLEEVINPKKEV